MQLVWNQTKTSFSYLMISPISFKYHNIIIKAAIARIKQLQYW
jgi:hypothetical protein